MRSADSGVLPRQNRVPPLDRRFNTAEPTYCQLIPPARASIIDSTERTGGWVLTPRRRLDRLVRVSAESGPCDLDRLPHRSH
jgi:hypothetical protein